MSLVLKYSTISHPQTVSLYHISFGVIVIALLRLQIHGIRVGPVGKRTGQHEIGGSHVGDCDVTLCSLTHVSVFRRNPMLPSG
jgi:hypothetical protein